VKVPYGSKYNLLLLRAAVGDINSGENDVENLSRVRTTSDFQSGWLPTDTTRLSLSKRTATKSCRQWSSGNNVGWSKWPDRYWLAAGYSPWKVEANLNCWPVIGAVKAIQSMAFLDTNMKSSQLEYPNSIKKISTVLNLLTCDSWLVSIAGLFSSIGAMPGPSTPRDSDFG